MVGIGTVSLICAVAFATVLATVLWVSSKEK